jgi:plasmid maintenance system antidote protein VapI
MLARAFGTSAEFWYNMAQRATEAEEQGRLT